MKDIPHMKNMTAQEVQETFGGVKRQVDVHLHRDLFGEFNIFHSQMCKANHSADLSECQYSMAFSHDFEIRYLDGAAQGSGKINWLQLREGVIEVRPWR